MRTAEEFYAAISEYVSTLKGKNGDKATKVTQDKRTSILKGIVPVLIAHGHNEPDEKDYEIYRASQNTSPATVNEYTKKIRVFFEWDRKKKITTPTTDETDILEITELELIQADDDNTHTEPIRNKGGRKRYDTKKGEKRSVKFMIYFTPSVMAEFKDLCSIKHTTCASYLFELACREIENNKEALTLFHESMSKLK